MVVVVVVGVQRSPTHTLSLPCLTTAFVTFISMNVHYVCSFIYLFVCFVMYSCYTIVTKKFKIMCHINYIKCISYHIHMIWG